MTFRQRLMLLTAVAIAVTVAGVSAGVWVVAKHQLLRQVDATLEQQAVTAVNERGLGPFGRQQYFYNFINTDGQVEHNSLNVPITAQERAVAMGRRDGYGYNTRIKNVHVRVLTVQLFNQADQSLSGAAVVATELTSTDHALARMRFWILLVGALGIGVAAALAAGVAAAALLPIRRLTAAAETVAQTGNLAERVDVGGDDELGRLANRFNEMLAALERSVGAQRRLVADASHELRTPLTAARTNVDLLREGKLPPYEVQHALDEAATELTALTQLVSDLVELARGEERKLNAEDVQLDDLVAHAVERAKARAPQATFVTSFSPTLVCVDPILVERAIGNLLDNAVKYSPAGAPIEVTVREGEVTVADHGPGIAAEDLPRIFDRFYRAATARSKPGAGLGLAIVKEAAEAHGGSATAESTAAGARFRLTLPAT